MVATSSFAIKQMSGSAMEAVINPVNGYRGELVRRGIEPKDHAKSNLSNIKQKQQKYKDLENKQKEETESRMRLFKMRRFQNIKPLVSSFRGSGELSDVPGVGSSAVEVSQPKSTLLRRCGSPDADAKSPDADAKSSDADAKSPASPLGTRISRMGSEQGSVRSSNLTTAEPYVESSKLSRKPRLKPPVFKASDVIPPKVPTSSKNFIKANVVNVVGRNEQLQAEHAVNRGEDRGPSSAQLHSNYGKIPEYLQDIKKDIADREEQNIEAKAAGKIPEGYRKMSEEERLQTVATLQQKHRDLEDKRRRLPLLLETDAQKRRQNVIEDQFKEINNALVVFSRPNVLIENRQTSLQDCTALLKSANK